MRETLVKLLVPQCNNPVDRDNPLGRYTIMTRICKQCGKEFEPCHSTSEFCSKSCATRYRNNEKIKDGSHNFYKLDRSKMAKDKVKNGTHPFLTGNMSKDALERKAAGIKRARIREAAEHKHPWQDPKNFINNEYSLSLNKSRKRGLSIVYLYYSECEFPDSIKIGWTYDVTIREKDPRCHDLRNITILKEGSPEEIILLEKNIKEKFYNKEYFNLYHSTEIFPKSLFEQIIEFINSI